MNYQEVIIIGAARSGTNMLRDVISGLPGCGTWPCDEINPIWRHGNTRWPTDALPSEVATPEVSAYLNRQFARRARRLSLSFVIEKTCANSLRVPFVARALPQARFLFLHRNPFDAVSSALERWCAGLDVRYTLRKARFVPPTDLPYYAWRFARNRWSRLTSGERRLLSWGPLIEGTEDATESRPLFELCALQWTACVEQAAKAFATMPPTKVHAVRYEAFVAAPEAELGAIRDFLGIEARYTHLQRAVANVTAASVGKGEALLSDSTHAQIRALTEPGRAALAQFLAASTTRRDPISRSSGRRLE